MKPQAPGETGVGPTPVGGGPIPRGQTGSVRSVPDPSRPKPRRILGVVTAGMEIAISVVAALVFFAVFLAALSRIIPLGVTMNEVVSPVALDGGAGDHRFSASLDQLAHLGDRLGARAALLTVLNTTVKRKPADAFSWSTVPSGTELQEGDAVQTTGDGTAMITFGHGTRLQLGQKSLMVIHANLPSGDAAKLPETPSVHVSLGELWGNVARDGGRAAEVSITSPGVQTHVTSGTDTAAAQFRIVVGQNKTSVLSVYRGVADVGARGQTVRVTANQFVAMDSVRGIATPRPLPAAPHVIEPDGGAIYRYRDLPPQVSFHWNTVPNADGYRLAISRNPEFRGVVLDQRLPGTQFSFGSFNSGPYYWHVSAMVAGAEGPPSAPRVVFVTSASREPALQVQFPTTVVNGDHITLNGISEPSVRVRVAGKPAHMGPSGRFEGLVALKRGFNVVVVEATDRVGNTAYKSKVVEAKF